jgi:leucine efflux protein
MLALPLQQLGAFVLASLLVIMIPGPATLFIATRSSRTAAAAGVLGIVAGDLMLIALACLGLGALLQQWPVLLGVIKWAGACYLVYLGVGMLWPRQAARNTPGDDRKRDGRGFATGLLITLSNPKPLLFFGAFFPLFIPAQSRDPWASFLALGLVFELLNLAYFGVLITLLGRVRTALQSQARTASALRTLAGLGLVGCAVLMLATR